MWCRHCCQDVPAVAADPTDGAVVCARCSTPLKESASPVRRMDPPQSSPDLVAAGEATRRPAWARSHLGLDDLALAADLDRADKILQQHRRALGPSTSVTATQFAQPEKFRERPGGVAVEPAAPAEATPAPRVATASAATVHLSWLVWSLVCGGMMALVFGMVLCGWSLGTAREDLWRIGLPSLLGGQAALLLGFVFQLDSLWRNYHETNRSLERLNRQLAQIRPPQED